MKRHVEGPRKWRLAYGDIGRLARACKLNESAGGRARLGEIAAGGRAGGR
jgi:hypothetical protein